MDQVLRPLPGHAVLLVLLQLSALLTVARLGSELVKRVGLPTVVGELAAGILLGPSVLGHFFPVAFAHLFPRDAEQMHLLEIISWLGMVLLLLLTGIETDVRLLKNLGRTAIAASLFGMVVPFVFGFGLGWVIPVGYVAAPDHRTIFALFLATAMSISAMPVIAKILLDLDLTRRNIGVVILSAGVVDDTTGWIILSLIAGAASGGAKLSGLVVSIGGTALFLVFAAFILYPVLRFALRITADRFQSKDSDLVLIIVTTLLCAAATDAIGVHAVFGAFVAGTVIRQVPRLRIEALHKIESVTFPIFAPIFFGMVGLKVDLWQLGDFWMLLLVLGVATAGKLVGCTAGSLLGGLRFWESFSIAVAMNARGAMELVVATIGLSLGILNQAMYSIVVMVAVTTSFMAPLLLRLTMRMVRMTEEEAERMAEEAAKGLFDAQKLRVLVPTAGGPNALVAASIAMCVTKKSAHPITVLYVERVSGFLDGIRRRLRPSVEGQNLAEHLELIRASARAFGNQEPEIRRQPSRDIADAINGEASKGYDLIMIGASGDKRGLQGQKLEPLVEGAPCHVAIVKHRGEKRTFSRLLVPVDGSFLSRVGIEFAIRYAEGAGPEAEVTFAILTGRDRSDELFSGLLDTSATMPARRPRDSIMLNIGSLAQGEGLDKLSPVFKATKVKTHLIMADGAAGQSILTQVGTGQYDLLVLGAENRAIHHRLFFGYDNERLVDKSTISVIVLVPKVTTAASE
jgi:Kef-type K+ transport system membrane component KefB/nucleotide-binding universal stress UspA family protein